MSPNLEMKIFQMAEHQFRRVMPYFTDATGVGKDQIIFIFMNNSCKHPGIVNFLKPLIRNIRALVNVHMILDPAD